MIEERSNRIQHKIVVSHTGYGLVRDGPLLTGGVSIARHENLLVDDRGRHATGPHDPPLNVHVVLVLDGNHLGRRAAGQEDELPLPAVRVQLLTVALQRDHHVATRGRRPRPRRGPALDDVDGGARVGGGDDLGLDDGGGGGGGTWLGGAGRVDGHRPVLLRVHGRRVHVVASVARRRVFFSYSSRGVDCTLSVRLVLVDERGLSPLVVCLLIR